MRRFTFSSTYSFSRRLKPASSSCWNRTPGGRRERRGASPSRPRTPSRGGQSGRPTTAGAVRMEAGVSDEEVQLLVHVPLLEEVGASVQKLLELFSRAILSSFSRELLRRASPPTPPPTFHRTRPLSNTPFPRMGQTSVLPFVPGPRADGTSTLFHRCQ